MLKSWKCWFLLNSTISTKIQSFLRNCYIFTKRHIRVKSALLATFGAGNPKTCKTFVFLLRFGTPVLRFRGRRSENPWGRPPSFSGRERGTEGGVIVSPLLRPISSSRTLLLLPHLHTQVTYSVPQRCIRTLWRLNPMIAWNLLKSRIWWFWGPGA